MDRSEVNILLRDLAWPVTVLVITLLLRVEFRLTLSRLPALRYRDVEANFEKGLREAEDLVKPMIASLAPGAFAGVVLEHEGGNGKSVPLPKNLDPERLLRIADSAPSAAIMEAWRDVEQAALAVGEARGIPAKGGESASSHAMHVLVDQGLLTSHTLVAFERLRRLHQQAAHHPDLRFSSNQAHRYIELAHKLVARLHGIAERGREVQPMSR